MIDIADAAAWVEMHREASRGIAVLEANKALARAKITEALGEETTGTLGGKVAVKIRRVPGRLDGKRLRADHPNVASNYIGPESERFTVVPSDD